MFLLLMFANEPPLTCKRGLPDPGGREKTVQDNLHAHAHFECCLFGWLVVKRGKEEKFKT